MSSNALNQFYHLKYFEKVLKLVDLFIFQWYHYINDTAELIKGGNMEKRDKKNYLPIRIDEDLNYRLREYVLKKKLTDKNYSFNKFVNEAIKNELRRIKENEKV